MEIKKKALVLGVMAMIMGATAAMAAPAYDVDYGDASQELAIREGGCTEPELPIKDRPIFAFGAQCMIDETIARPFPEDDCDMLPPPVCPRPMRLGDDAMAPYTVAVDYELKLGVEVGSGGKPKAGASFTIRF